MKKIVVLLAAMLFVPSISTLVGKQSDSQSSAAVLRCTLSGSAYVVTAVSAVTGGPTVTIGEACAQALTDHLNAGFSIDSTQLEQGTASLVYTLVNDQNSN